MDISIVLVELTSDWIRLFTLQLDSSFCINGSVGFGFLNVCSLDATRDRIFSSLFKMDDLSSPNAKLELDLRCWNVLRAYATTNIAIGEVEAQLSSIFQDSGYLYEDYRWGPKMGRIMDTEEDDIAAMEVNLRWIDDAISDLSMALFTSPIALSPQSPPPASAASPPNREQSLIDVDKPDVIDLGMAPMSAYMSQHRTWMSSMRQLRSARLVCVD